LLDFDFVGDVTGSQPWAVQFEARAKWDAWNEQAGKSKETAMAEYVALLDEGMLMMQLLILLCCGF
jgi:acyl-CoA-binding protein